jgi:hypothetical protein
MLISSAASSRQNVPLREHLLKQLLQDVSVPFNTVSRSRREEVGALSAKAVFELLVPRYWRLR